MRVEIGGFGVRRSVAASVVQSALLLPVALAVRYAFNTLIPHDHIGRLALVTAGAFGLFVVSAAIGLGSRYVVLGVTKRSMTGVRAAMLERLGFKHFFVATVARSDERTRHLCEAARPVSDRGLRIFLFRPGRS